MFAARIGQKNEELPSVSICPAVPRALLCHSKRRHQRSRRLYLYALRYTLCPDEARSCPAAAKECESEELELLQPIGILLLRPLPVSLPPFYTWLQSGVRAVVTLEWCGPVKLADKQLAQLQVSVASGTGSQSSGILICCFAVMQCHICTLTPLPGNTQPSLCDAILAAHVCVTALVCYEQLVRQA